MAQTGRHGVCDPQTDGRRFARDSSRYERAAFESQGSRGLPSILAGILIGLAVVVVLFAALLVPSLIRIRSAVSSLSVAADDLVASVKGDGSGDAEAAIETIEDDVSAIESSLNGPAWSILTIVPVYGQDIVNARSLLSAASGLVEGALVPLADTLETYPLDSLVTDGSINGEALRAYCDVLAGQASTIKESLATLGSLDTFHISQIEDAVAQLRSPAELLASLLDSDGTMIRLLPDMLGCSGARHYLFIAQNNVEIRATGGFPGAIMLVTVENGSISFGDVENSWVLPTNYDNPVSITDEEETLFGLSLGAVCGNMNGTPDFSRAAELWSQGWMRDYGLQIDGVFATDPVLFGRIIELTGQGVTLSDGTYVDGRNFASELMHDTYWDFSWSDYDASTANEMMDARFAEAAGDCIALLKDSLGSMDLSSLLEVLLDGIDEGRLLGWMYQSEEEALMESLGCAGTLNSDATQPELGIYLNDDTWSKISWWLDLTTEVSSGVTNDDGTTSYYVTTTLSNTMTYEEADSASVYIKGNNPLKRDNSDAITSIYLVSPAGGSITDVQVSGTGLLEVSGSSYEGHQVTYGRSQLRAGESVTLTYTVTVSAESQSKLTVHHTPLARE